jgi:hypothetical protein
MSFSNVVTSVNEPLTTIRPVTEALYFLSGIAIACIAAIGLKQVRLLKIDLVSRTRRAASERAVDACTQFLTQSIPLSSALLTDYQKAGLKNYDGPIGDFSAQSLSPDALQALKKKIAVQTSTHLLNALECIAMAFTTGVADEEVGFPVIGRAFCDEVQYHYDGIALMHDWKPHSKYYTSIVKLYGVWSQKLKQAELSAKEQNLTKELVNLRQAMLSAPPPEGLPRITPEL